MIGRRAAAPCLIVAWSCLGAACASGGTSPFDKTYVALVYGRVTQGGIPAAGVSVKGELYTTTCPSSALQQTSSQSAQTDADGDYRLLLTSTLQSAGQCLVLRVTGAQPMLHTLDDTPFSAESPGPPLDSLRLDASVP